MIMRKWTRLAWLLLYIMFSAVPPAKPSACPTCTRGVGPEACKDGQYWSQRNLVGMCNDCTASCHDNRNMIEVNPCTKRSDRKCQCKAGYYCPSPVKQTCRRACEPCESGFTDTSNLNRSCQRYTQNIHCTSRLTAALRAKPCANSNHCTFSGLACSCIYIDTPSKVPCRYRERGCAAFTF